MELDPDIRAYYDRGGEADRLVGGFPSGPLELARTQELLLRFLSDGPLDILDVGGGPGVYAAWLASQGHRVHLVDPVPLHVEQARAAHASVSAEVGDARALTQADASFDAALSMGPLYHLVDRDDRLQSLLEARRVLRPTGLIFVATISRFAALLDLLLRADLLSEPGIFEIVREAVRTGIFGGPGRGDLFTTAYFHLPREIVEELEEAGFSDVKRFQIEGPGAFLPDFASRWSDPARRETLLEAARLVEDEPEMLAASGHLLSVARLPGPPEP